MKLPILLSSIATVSQATTTLFGKCPTPPTIQTFFPNLYLGTWYEIARDQWIPFELMATCTTATYTNNSDGTIGVTNRAWYWYYFFSYNVASGKAGIASPGKLTVSFNPFGQTAADVTGKTPNYNILLTDYTGYSVVYSCASTWLGLAIDESMWLLGRQQTMTDGAYTAIKN